VNIKIVNTLSEDKWRSFVDQHPTGNIFHTPEMFRVFARAKGHQPTLWAAVDSNNDPLALLTIVNVSLASGPLRKFTTRAIAYGSVLCAPGDQGSEALVILLRAYQHQAQNSILFTELRNLSDLGHLQSILNSCGFTYEEHLNYLIDLNRPSEAVFQSIGPRTRKNLRHALRQRKVIIEEIKQPEQVIASYELIRKTYRSARIPLTDRSLFEAAFELLYPKDMIRFTVARVEGNPAATSIELLYKDVVYGWYGGTDRTYSACLPNELLTWHILQWGSENGYHVYDFGGAGKPDEKYGVRDFKAKFGGDLVCYGRNTCVHTPQLLELSIWGYGIYRRLMHQF
jgi:serine/alanine adding enzyme